MHLNEKAYQQKKGFKKVTFPKLRTGSDDLFGSLASELGDEFLDLFSISLATASSDDSSDILFGGIGLSAENSEEISGDVLHDSVSALLWGALWEKRTSMFKQASSKHQPFPIVFTLQLLPESESWLEWRIDLREVWVS
jgi:hypothetical protein